MSRSGRSPWLTIPAADYDGHMSSPQVRQAQYLAGVFRELLRAYSPESLAVIGCATGNGFDAIPAATARVVGVDINPDYLGRLRERCGDRLPSLELVCADICEQNDALRPFANAFDLLHCALVFEYVEPAAVLETLVGWLRERARLSVVLQLPSSNASAVTETEYKSLRALEPIMRLIAHTDFEEVAVRAGLRIESKRIDTLRSGKQFYVGVFRRP